MPKPQTSISSQDVSQLSFEKLTVQSLSVITPNKIPFREESEFSCFQIQLSDELKSVELELCSPISPQQRQKTVLSN